MYKSGRRYGAEELQVEAEFGYAEETDIYCLMDPVVNTSRHLVQALPPVSTLQCLTGKADKN